MHAPSPPQVFTDDEVLAYHETGLAGPFPLCTPDEMAELRARVDRVMETEGQAPSPDRTQERGRLADLVERQGRSPVPYIECRHLDSRLIYDLCTHPAVLERVRRLYGPDLILWRSTLINKPAGGPAFRWHQDYGGVYHAGNEYGLEPPFHFNVYLALTDATVAHGCLQFIPGVHAVLPTVPASDAPKATLLVDPAYVDPQKVVHMELRAGEFLIFSDRALHASGPNQTDERRLALVSRITHPIVRVRPHYDGHAVVLISGTDPLGVNAMAAPPV